MKQVGKAFALVLLGLAGCTPKEVPYSVNIISQVCDPALDPFAGVQWLRVRVTGDDIATPLVQDSLKDAASRSVTIPEIPAGTNRVVEVRGYDGDPSSAANVVSMGRSVQFTVPDVVPTDLGGPISVNVFMRKVNTFTPPSAAQAPTTCSKMKVSRAGHAATLLKSGKVFVSGGFNLKSGTTEKVSLSDTETFNPATGVFEAARDISVNNGTIKLPKAFHTATRLPSGQVLLWGGEQYANANGNPNVISPTSIIVIYDPDTDDYGALGSRANLIPRTQHSSAIDANGKVLIVGGLTRSNQALVPTDKVEWFNPSDNSYQIVDGVTLARVGGSAVPVRGKGEFIAVAGGADATHLATEVTFFKYDGTTFKQQAIASPPRLADPGRRSAAAATLTDGNDLVVLGGYSDLSAPKPLDTTELIATQSATVSSGPTIGKRGELCAVTLQDGSILAIGGRTADSAGANPHSDATSAVVKASGSGGATAVGGPSLKTPRYAHTCTLLSDGTVLVTGGINEQTSGAQDILSDAFIYQPAPTN